VNLADADKSSPDYKDTAINYYFPTELYSEKIYSLNDDSYGTLDLKILLGDYELSPYVDRRMYKITLNMDDHNGIIIKKTHEVEHIHFT